MSTYQGKNASEHGTTVLVLPVVRDPSAPKPRQRRAPRRKPPDECFTIKLADHSFAYVGMDRDGTELIRIELPNDVFNTIESLQFGEIVADYIMRRHDLIAQPSLRAERGGAYVPSSGSARRLRPRGIAHWYGEVRSDDA